MFENQNWIPHFIHRKSSSRECIGMMISDNTSELKNFQQAQSQYIKPFIIFSLLRSDQTTISWKSYPRNPLTELLIFGFDQSRRKVYTAKCYSWVEDEQRLLEANQTDITTCNHCCWMPRASETNFPIQSISMRQCNRFKIHSGGSLNWRHHKDIISTCDDENHMLANNAVDQYPVPSS